MRYIVDNLRNNIDFFIRKKTRFSKKNFSLDIENVDNCFDEACLERENELKKKYDFSLLQKDTNKNNYRENLYLLDILDRYLFLSPENKAKILDIGSKNWFYAKGEYCFFKANFSEIEMTGIEIDAYRLDCNLYSRYEIAKFYIKDLEGAEYQADDFLNNNDSYDYIIWILPFLNKYPHVKWGLPLRCFDPEKIFEHAYNRLNNNGKILIINQGEDEYLKQKKVFEKMKISYEALDEISSIFLEYKYKRFASIVAK